MKYHNQLILIKGIELMLEAQGPGFDRHELRTCRSLKSWVSKVFYDCDSDFTDLRRKLDVWVSLSDEQVESVDRSIQRHLAHVTTELFDHFLTDHLQPDISELFWDAIEEEVERQTNLTILLGDNQ